MLKDRPVVEVAKTEVAFSHARNRAACQRELFFRECRVNCPRDASRYKNDDLRLDKHTLTVEPKRHGEG